MLSVNEKDFEIYFAVNKLEAAICIRRDQIKEDVEYILDVEKPENVVELEAK